MRTLIVDDEYGKVRVVTSILATLGQDDCEVVMSAHEALEKIEIAQYDLMIIDLQIPPRLGETVDPTGGQALLELLELKSGIRFPTHIIGITAFQESLDACSAFFRSRGWALILGVDNEDELTTILGAKIRHATLSGNKYDVAIVTAVEEVELRAVLSLPCSWEAMSLAADCNVYHVGEFRIAEHQSVSVIATGCARVGMAHAAATSMKMCLKFQPKILLMVGITAGIAGKTEVGDVIVADPTWDWGSSKLTTTDGRPTIMNEPYQISLNPRMRALARSYAQDRQRLDEIQGAWKGSNRPDHKICVHVGPVASGAAVLEDPAIVDRINEQHRKTIGIEMEAYGVMTAAGCLGNKAPVPIVVKSVSDFANPWKDDKWQSYAAYTSAAVGFDLVKRFLTEHSA
ncbi:MAG: hypothetical protein ABI640_20640 [Gammaproteobacteria bacterium]